VASVTANYAQDTNTVTLSLPGMFPMPLEGSAANWHRFFLGLPINYMSPDPAMRWRADSARETLGIAWPRPSAYGYGGSSPLRWIDRDGRELGAAAFGALVGFVTGALADGFYAYGAGACLSGVLKSAAIGAVTGAIGGAVGGLTLDPNLVDVAAIAANNVIANIVGGAVSGGLDFGFGAVLDGKGASAVLAETTLGAIGGGFGGAVAVFAPEGSGTAALALGQMGAQVTDGVVGFVQFIILTGH
jgi:hypothetical protein